MVWLFFQFSSHFLSYFLKPIQILWRFLYLGFETCATRWRREENCWNLIIIKLAEVGDLWNYTASLLLFHSISIESLESREKFMSVVCSLFAKSTSLHSMYLQYVWCFIRFYSHRHSRDVTTVTTAVDVTNIVFYDDAVCVPKQKYDSPNHTQSTHE